MAKWPGVDPVDLLDLVDLVHLTDLVDSVDLADLAHLTDSVALMPLAVGAMTFPLLSRRGLGGGRGC